MKKEIRFAMLVGMNNQSPEVQAKWNEIRSQSDELTPEEVLIYLNSQVSNRYV